MELVFGGLVCPGLPPLLVVVGAVDALDGVEDGEGSSGATAPRHRPSSAS